MSVTRRQRYALSRANCRFRRDQARLERGLPQAEVARLIRAANEEELALDATEPQGK